MSEAGSNIEVVAWKPAWDILAERHPRYRELFEADPGTWGPELDRTFANLNPNRQGGRWPGPDNGWVAPPGDGQVTVVISSRNRPEECRRAVESALAQTRRPARVIVVKNGPGGREAYSDALAGLLGGLDGNGVPVVSLLWEPDLSGIAGPINAGLRRASTEYVAVLDDDDEWKPNFLEELCAALDSDRSLGLAYCEARHPTDLGPGRVFGHAAPPPNQDFLSAMKAINWFGWSQAVWRRELLAPDYLNSSAGGCADRDAWLRIGLKAGVYHVARLLASHWWHGDNASLDTAWITEGHEWVERGIKAGRYGAAVPSIETKLAPVGDDIWVGNFMACEANLDTFPRSIHIWHPWHAPQWICRNVTENQGRGLNVAYREHESLSNASIDPASIAAYARTPGRLLIHCAAGGCRGPTIAVLAKVARGKTVVEAQVEIRKGMLAGYNQEPEFPPVPMAEIAEWAAQYAGASPTEPALPSWPRMAANYVGAQLAAVASGWQEVDAGTKAARLAVCRSCDRYRPSEVRCAECGCFLDDGIWGKGRASLAAMACPIGKWQAYVEIKNTGDGTGKCGGCGSGS
jgi:hypothetical protein